MQNVYDNFVNC